MRELPWLGLGLLPFLCVCSLEKDESCCDEEGGVSLLGEGTTILLSSMKRKSWVSNPTRSSFGGGGRISLGGGSTTVGVMARLVGRMGVLGSANIAGGAIVSKEGLRGVDEARGIKLLEGVDGVDGGGGTIGMGLSGDRGGGAGVPKTAAAELAGLGWIAGT